MMKAPSDILPQIDSSDHRFDTHTNKESTASNRFEWWYRLSAPAEVAESANFNTREQYRRGRVASLIILGTLCAIIVLLPIVIIYAPVPFNLPWVFASATVGLLCCLLAIPANRFGRVQLAGILLIVAVDVIVAGIILSEKNGLDPIFLSMFDLLVVTELIAASILNPSSVFGVALINVLLIVLDLNLQPHSMMWMQMVMTQTLAYSLLARPVTLYLVVAAVAFLWVRSALRQSIVYSTSIRILHSFVSPCVTGKAASSSSGVLRGKWH